jgi:prephenate dehydrogenase
MAGSGFESTVRLAKSSPMWTPIFKQNKEQVIETLEEYISNLTHFKELLIKKIMMLYMKKCKASIK